MRNKRRKQRKIKKIALWLITILILSCVGFTGYLLFNNKPSEPAKEKYHDNKVKEEWPKEYSLSMIMTGDALIHDSVYKDAMNSDGTFNFEKQIELIKPIVEKYDLAYYNGETVIGGKELGYSSYPMFNTPEAFADTMVNAGFNMVSLATNHTMDKGEKGILNSHKYWNEKDVLTAGSYISEEDRTMPNIKEKNNITYTMISYTMLNNGLNNPSGKEFYNVMYSDEKAKADIERVRDKVDVLIVTLHWGVEYSMTPSARQKEIAQYLADLNVDIVIGTHPHVLQPIEFINDTIVYYSLGNFISAQEGSNKLTGVLASLKITKTINKDGTFHIKLSDFNNELIYTSYKKTSSKWYDFKVIPYTTLNDSILTNYKSVYEDNVKVLRQIDDSVVVMSIE